MSKSSVYFGLNDALSSHDIKHIKTQLNGISGVISVSVGDDFKTLAIDFDSTGVSTDKLKRRISRTGLEIAHERLERHMM